MQISNSPASYDLCFAQPLGAISVPSWRKRCPLLCQRRASYFPQQNRRHALITTLKAVADPLGSSAGSQFDEPLLEDDPLIVDLSEVPQRTKKVRRRTGNLVSEIDSEKPVEDTIDPTLLPPVHLDEVADFARTAVRAADKRKAEAPVVFRVSNVSFITTFMVCVTGKNTPQIRAIANMVEEDLFKEHKLKPKNSTRSTNSGWLLLDYGDLMVHIFSPEQRENYNMEQLWRKAEPLDISDCIVTGPVASDKGGTSEDDDWL